MLDRLKEDIACVKDRDPAARTTAEVLLLYPGLKAIVSHRVAHSLWQKDLKLAARWMSQRCVRKTNIEIHPAAKLGRRVFIDHGTGVVIGETAEVGDDVTIYQGVTLGGTGKECGKRHPTIGDRVMVGSGAKILGPVTVGSDTKIASGAVVLRDIPENCTAVGVPARIVKRDGQHIDYLDQIDIPDPVVTELNNMQRRIAELERELETLRGAAYGTGDAAEE
ncbi:MAG: serine O-acetyltransferase [Clostridia bacterium]|nr:serine O-acetyltransferase [Clostridia bacterium]